MSSMCWFPVGRKYQFQLHGSPSPGESREVLGVAKKSEPKVWGWVMSPELFRKLDLELRRLLLKVLPVGCTSLQEARHLG